MLVLLLYFSPALSADRAYHQPPPESDIPQGRYGDDVRFGLKIFTNTSQFARRYSGNDLNCSSCHLDRGRKPNAAPMWGAFGMYPAYLDDNDQNNTLQERIQLCFQYNLDGFKPGTDTPEMKALVSYIHFLSRGVPVAIALPGRGFPALEKTEFSPNPEAGKATFLQYCQGCHDESGASNKTSPIPALWGMNSYNKASSFYESTVLARFIHANKPLSEPGKLTTQQALDIAAYINQQLRPGDPRKGFLEGLLD